VADEVLAFSYGGLTVRSELRLDGLLPTAHEAVVPSLCVRFAPSPPSETGDWIHHWLDGAGFASLLLARTPEGFLLRFPELADFEIGPDMEHIGVHSAGAATTETLRHLLVDQVLPRVMAHRGSAVIHAGAVAFEAGAVALLGDSGAGKSTLTASLREAGAGLLSDDGLVLERRACAVHARATYPSLRLWPPAVEGVFAAPPVGAPMAHYSTKRRLIVPETSAPATEPKRIGVMFALGRPDGRNDDRVQVERLHPRDACIALLKNSFQLDVSDVVRAGRLFTELSVIAEMVPMYSLTYPRDFSRLPEVHAAIRRVVEEERESK
jgi:hypothetical protein